MKNEFKLENQNFSPTEQTIYSLGEEFGLLGGGIKSHQAGKITDYIKVPNMPLKTSHAVQVEEYDKDPHGWGML